MKISAIAAAVIGCSAFAAQAQIKSSDIQVSASALFAGGASTVGDEVLGTLQGGGHDPNRNGFTIQNIELTFGGPVDPYFDGQMNLIFSINEEGETISELEEAYILSRALPAGLQLKAGQYFTEFGRHNAQHPHLWAFTDQPVVLTRMFGGDGLRSQGARLSWLMPTDWYSETYVGVQNAKGETAYSFLSSSGGHGGAEESEEASFGGYHLEERPVNGPEDVLYSFRWLNGLDLNDNTSMNVGLSALLGPNATGEDTSTRIMGADLYLKWQPDYSQRGFPFVAWHTEMIGRHYEAEDHDTEAEETLRDRGGFTQLLYGFKPGWVAGARYGWAGGNGTDDSDALRNDRQRLSLNLSWYPSEFSKIRLQYNYDRAEHLEDDDAHGLWLQMEYSLGSHAAHTF